jgi:ribonuclease HII
MQNKKLSAAKRENGKEKIKRGKTGDVHVQKFQRDSDQNINIKFV